MQSYRCRSSVNSIYLLMFGFLIGHSTLTDANEDYCNDEIFQPRCLKNEVILISSATYGRMRIGRCITEDELKGLEEFVGGGDDPRKLGCSQDVSDLLHRKCSGRTECDIRSSDFTSENIQPCLRFLKMYLEVSYDCISVVDETRSCLAAASKNPIHIIGPGAMERKCGTNSQPFIVEAPVGEKISIKLSEFSVPNSRESPREGRPQCQSYGLVVDKIGKQNVSICVKRAARESNVHISNGNTVEIVLDPPKRNSLENNSVFSVKLEAVGCSNLIPPKDAWLKRMDDTIVIGCYTARQTWKLHCRDGKWVGVMGNCSNALFEQEDFAGPTSKVMTKTEDGRQALVIVVIVGATVTFCLTVICTGVVCLRRFYTKSQKYQEYKTLNFPTGSLGNQLVNQQFPSRVADGSNIAGATDALAKDLVPTYSVYVGESGSTGAN